MAKSDILTLTGEKDASPSDKFSRRKFFTSAAMAAAGIALAPPLSSQEKAKSEKPPAQPADIKTNIDEVRGIPRVEGSLPGKYPGKVVRVKTGANPVGQKIDGARVRKEMNAGMAELTGEKMPGMAWAKFVGPRDVVGIKVNPIGGSILSTKPEVVDVIIEGLLEAGVPKANIVIWDRRLFQLEEAGFTAARFPGIRILGTEMKGPNGEFYDDKRSYFTKIVTGTVTKIINVPILKNAGATTTCCLKNLSYGSLSNTSRLHKLWMKSVVEPCAFPALRDKVVLKTRR